MSKRYQHSAQPGDDFSTEDSSLSPGQFFLGQLPPALVERHGNDVKHGWLSEQEEETQKRKKAVIPAPGLWQQMDRRRRTLIIGSVIGLLVLVAGGISFMALHKAFAPPVDVSLYKVGVLQNAPLSIGGGGITFPKQRVDVVYPAAERVISVMVKAGDRVTPNQSLVKLDASQLNVAIQQAADDMQAAQAYLNSVSALGTATNIAQAQQSYDIARSKYNALVSQAASPLYHDGTLVSPMNGVVTAVNVNVGEVFSANSNLVTIMDESTEFVHIKVPLADLGQIQSGQNATVTPAALPDLNLSGSVSNVIPQADPQTDTFEVWVSVDNAKGVLLPGMSAFARIQATTKAISLPRLAVLYPNSDAAVYVVRNQVASLQNVQVIGRSVDKIYIGNGLRPGDQIVLVGIDGVQDGQRVHVTRVTGP